MRLLFILLSLFLTQTSFAASTTTGHVVGFSKDGRYFVFEEFVIQDGSGFPQATLYIIDTTDDSWLKGTPIKAQRELDESDGSSKEYAELERKGIASVRKEVRDRAASIMNRIGPIVPATQRVFNTVYDFGANTKKARFSIIDYQQTINTPTTHQMWRLELDPITFPADDSCFDLTAKKEGFRLRLIDELDDSSRTVAEDKRIPKSRGCASNNKIEQVVSYQIDRTTAVLGVLIRYSHPGFEGSDGSLLAITTRIKK
ncbi:MAG: DUF2259 domain-containing protein [Rhizobiaceae bacterium]